MFNFQKIMDLINSGGTISYLLILCSVISLAIIINKILCFKAKGKISNDDFLGTIEAYLDKNEINKAIEYCESNSSIFANITAVALPLKDKNLAKMNRAIDREISRNIKELERYSVLVGTIANISVYLGLLGTIIGIIEAFNNISTQGMGGIDIVIGGVSKALITTAFGLMVAIPAVIAYNYFLSRVEGFVKEMEFYVEELLLLLGQNK